MLGYAKDEDPAVRRDARGLEVSTASDSAISAIDRFAFDLVSLGGDPTAVRKAARAEPECAMLQAYGAALNASAQSSAEAEKARPLLSRARENFARLTERERLFIEAIDAGCEGDFARALARYEEIAGRWPTDIVAAKLAEFHFFETGEAERQLRFMASIEANNRDQPHVLAMYAFAMELNGLRAQAEAVSWRALEIDPNTMWAQHCLAHVYSGDFRIDEGIAAMEDFAPTWKAFGPYIQAHNWFHLGVLYLGKLEYDRARAAFRSHIWGITPDLVVEQTDAILLLWYLELAGADIDIAAWKEIAPHVKRGAIEHVFPFLNAICIYALGRAGEHELAHEAVARMEDFARSQSGPAADLWFRVGLPQARACLAFAEGDWKRAARLFETILPDIARGGGSDEQRGVFSQSYLLSLIHGGERAGARRTLDSWIGSRAPIPLEQHWLGRL
jgi:tetratricopeptide (TPR) repeat protein